MTRLARRLRRHAPALAAVLAIVLLPFAIAGRHADAFVTQMLAGAADRPIVAAAVIAGALAADALLPVPSSLVATAAGYLLGFARGALASFAGLTAGSLIGYAVGRFALPPLGNTVGRFAMPPRGDTVGRFALPSLGNPGRRWGDWLVAVTRPVPVLAESATLLAGACRFPLRRFLAVSALSNLCVAIVYAVAGALSATWHAPTLALLAACGLPAAALLLAGCRSRSATPGPAPDGGPRHLP